LYLYIELWNAKSSWLALDTTGRAAFMKKVDGLLKELMSDEVKLIGCTLNDGSTAPRLDYRYVAVWQMKDISGTHKVADGTARIGWYEYFDQVNVGGEWIAADAMISEMMSI
jgi:hypothetical protein